MTSDTGNGGPGRGVVQDLGWGRLVFGLKRVLPHRISHVLAGFTRAFS